MAILSLAIAYTGVIEFMAVLPLADGLNNIVHHQWLSGRSNLKLSREQLLGFLNKVLNPQTLGNQICQMNNCKY